MWPAPTKAKNIKRLAEILSETYKAWCHSPWRNSKHSWVGHKTASVVVAQCFEPAFPVDTHIHRLAARWGLSAGTTVERTEKDLKALFPRETGRRRTYRSFSLAANIVRQDFTTYTCPICSWAATKKRIREEKLRDNQARGR